MSISINYPNGYSFAECRRVEVHGLPGIGGYTLVLRMEFSIHPPQTETFIRGVRLRVDWGDDSQRLLGTSVPDEQQPIRITQHCNSASFSFRLLLSPEQIETIEMLRDGGDFALKVWLCGEVTQLTESQSFQGYERYAVSQQMWVRALESMGYQRTLLYEYKLPEQSDGLDGIVKRAMYHLHRGHYDECVGECRKLLEVKSQGGDGKEQLKTARDKYKGDREQRESMTVNERMLVLREVATHATHTAHHHNSGDGYSRDQAKAILGCVMSLMEIS